VVTTTRLRFLARVWQSRDGELERDTTQWNARSQAALGTLVGQAARPNGRTVEFSFSSPKRYLGRYLRTQETTTASCEAML